MKKIALSFIVALALFSSCSRNQFNIVQSTNTVKDANNGHFVQENDSVKITYSFAGNNVPVTVEVFNKLNKPLLIDWKQSAMIVGDKTVSFTSNDITIKGEFKTDYYLTAQLKTAPGTLKAMAPLPKELSFVAPYATVTSTPLTIGNNLSNTFANLATVKESHPNKIFTGTQVKFNTANFTENDSPFKFRGYLTIKTTDEHLKTMVFTPHFYVAKYISIKSELMELGDYTSSRGDIFSIK